MSLFGKKSESKDMALPVDLESYEDSIYGRADALMASLRLSFARPEDVGQSFGSHSGLDTAIDWVQYIAPDPLEYRPIGRRAADSIISGIRSGAISLENLMDVLGVTDGALMRLRKKADRLSVGFTYDNCVQLLLAMSKDDMAGMSKWFKDDGYATRMTAYLLVGCLRLQAAGTGITY